MCEAFILEDFSLGFNMLFYYHLLLSDEMTKRPWKVKDPLAQGGFR